jgi:hypothetical protein
VARTLAEERSRQFGAVSIESDWRGCCEASCKLARQRFLAGEAPMLPLNACSQPGDCHCVYKHWSDRRTGERRAEYDGRTIQYSADIDRRGDDDRRSE